MRPWHLRYARLAVYAFAAVTAISIVGVSLTDARDAGQALVSARQLFGLWSLALLLASLALGPLTSLVPRLPLRSSFMYARRAIGISAAAMAGCHVVAYIWSLLRRDWREAYSPGWLWVAGLALGTIALAEMLLLAASSTDAAVKRLGGRRWKRLHRTVYAALGLVFLHALLTGADFGWKRAPDVTGQPDAGAGIGFVVAAAAWLALYCLRARGVRWTRTTSQASIR